MIYYNDIHLDTCNNLKLRSKLRTDMSEISRFVFFDLARSRHDLVEGDEGWNRGRNRNSEVVPSRSRLSGKCPNRIWTLEF